MSTRFSPSPMAVALLVLAGTLPAGAASVLPNAVPTITLGAAPQGNVTWDPAYQRYYATATGNPSMQAFVFNAAGTLIQQQTLGIDQRTFNYNSNTSQLEMVAYYPSGLYSVARDGSGNLTGGSSVINTTMGAWVLPVYDPGRNRFYSFSGGNTIDVQDYAGNVLTPITLDLAPAGNPQLTYYTVGYDAVEDKLITLDYTNKRALVHDINGNFIGASQLPSTQSVPFNYFMGYTNGQLFVYGQGYDIFGTPVPLPSAALGGVALLGVLAARRTRPIH